MSFDELLFDYVTERYLPDRRRGMRGGPRQNLLKFFAKGVAEVSRSFTSERAERSQRYFNRPEFRSGYLLYFLPTNVPKVTHTLRIADAAARFQRKSELAVLDLGSGPGTGTLAIANYFRTESPSTRLAIDAVDQTRHVLHDAESLFERSQFPNATLKTRTLDITQRSGLERIRGRYHIICCANVLNEMGPIPHRVRLMGHLLRNHLHQGGIVIIIEPALRGPTRDLMTLRDQLLVHHPSERSERSPIVPRVIAPCLHHAPCPMLAHNNRDWCHAYLDWKRPQLIIDLDHLIGNRKDYLKFSYLILQHRPSSQPLAADVPMSEANGRPSPDLFRVVSAPLRSKGKQELLLCPSTEAQTCTLHRLTRLNRDKSENNQGFDQTLRGDLVKTRNSERLKATDAFDIITPFSNPKKSVQ
jgi:ribosomal protein RSM22 (predicted rRNA methylase)